MKVIVTGGSGKVGKSVISTLVARGHEVINLDRRPADRPGAKFVYMDLRRREMLQPIMEQAEAVVHMGEIPNAQSGHYTQEEVFGTNCTIGSLIAQLALECGHKRLIYSSTIQVYGFTDWDYTAPFRMPIDEDHPANPRNCYSAGKVAIESYMRLCATKGLSVAVFRLPWVVTRDVDESWFQWTEQEKKLDSSFGIYVRDSDAAECMALALENPRPGFEAYNLSAREVMFGIPIRQAIAANFPDYPQLPETWGAFDSPYIWTKAREHFGWTPKWNYLDEFRKARGRDPVVN